MPERVVLYSRETGFQEDSDGLDIPALRSKLLTAEEAESLIRRLNRQFASFRGRNIEIDCGQSFLVEDGEQTGEQLISGRDMDERRNAGIKEIGVFRRFDVLDYEDDLVNRGTKITVHEPCIVYQEKPPKIHSIPEPEVTEIFVPLIRLGQITEMVQ